MFSYTKQEEVFVFLAVPCRAQVLLWETKNLFTFLSLFLTRFRISATMISEGLSGRFFSAGLSVIECAEPGMPFPYWYTPHLSDSDEGCF